ncbi:hypothetical protein H5T51_01340 [Candidatus Bathyarchaeota archaeon]|nr:hypothetical protein [Candidatus Bathyarchaeota archaeon]
MSTGRTSGLTTAEKFFGLILIIVGALAAYFTFTSSEALSVYTGLFGLLSIVLVIVGVLMIIAKAE